MTGSTFDFINKNAGPSSSAIYTPLRRGWATIQVKTTLRGAAKGRENEKPCLQVSS